MNLAIIVPRWSATVIGGAERLAANYARLLRHDHKVTVLTTCALDHITWRNELPAGEFTEDGITVRRFPADPRDAARYAQLQEGIYRHERLAAAAEAAWQENGVVSSALLNHVRDTPYDLVLGLPYLFGVVQQGLRAAGRRAVLVPCLHPEPHAELALVREMFAGAGAVFFNAPEEKALALRLYGKLPDCSPVIGMGLPFAPEAPARPQPGADYLLYLGRKEAGKGTHLLAAYFQRYRERFPASRLRLILAGGGEFPHFPRLAGFLETRDWLDEAEKERLLGGALALVQPSAMESLSIVTLEAWRLARPVLVNGRSAVQRGNVDRSGGGLWYDGEEMFIRCLHALAENPAQATVFGRRGWSYLRRHHDPALVRARLLDAVAGLAPASCPSLCA